MTTIANDTVRLIADYVNLVKQTSRLQDKEAKEFGLKLIEDKATQLFSAGLTADQVSLISKAVLL